MGWFEPNPSHVWTASTSSSAQLLAQLQAQCAVAAFHEPDLGGQLTAIAAGGEAKRYLRHLPLALRHLAAA